MEILAKVTDCYMQKCDKCKSVLKYSSSDINVSGSVLYLGGDPWTFCYDTVICPSCGKILDAYGGKI